MRWSLEAAEALDRFIVEPIPEKAQVLLWVVAQDPENTWVRMKKEKAFEMFVFYRGAALKLLATEEYQKWWNKGDPRAGKSSNLQKMEALFDKAPTNPEDLRRLVEELTKILGD